MDEFMKRLHKNCNGGRISDAYEQAEQEHILATGQRRYKNYNTFKSTLSRFRRMKKVNKIAC